LPPEAEARQPADYLSFIFIQLVSLVPHGYCYNVKAASASEQVAEILTAFNIVVSTDDIFSRCQVSYSTHTGNKRPTFSNYFLCKVIFTVYQACNSNEFLKLGRETAKKLHRKLCLADTGRPMCEDESKGAKDDQGITDNRSWKLISEPPELLNNGLTNRGVKIQVRLIILTLRVTSLDFRFLYFLNFVFLD